MRPIAALTALFAAAAFGQAVLQVRHATNTQDFQEIATAIRAVAAVDVVANDVDRTVTVTSADANVPMLEWILRELDDPDGVRNFKVSDDDALLVYYLPHVESLRDFQEMATLVRSTAEIRRLFTYNRARAIVSRGTPDRLAMAEWLYQHLDSATPAEYKVADNDFVRVLFLPAIDSIARFQQVVTQMRTATRIPRVFTHNALRAVAIRGTPDQISAALRMLETQASAPK